MKSLTWARFHQHEKSASSQLSPFQGSRSYLVAGWPGLLDGANLAAPDLLPAAAFSRSIGHR